MVFKWQYTSLLQKINSMIVNGMKVVRTEKCVGGALIDYWSQEIKLLGPQQNKQRKNWQSQGITEVQRWSLTFTSQIISPLNKWGKD